MQLFTISTHRAYLNTDIIIEWLYGNPNDNSYTINYKHCNTKETYRKKEINHIGGYIAFLSPHKKETIRLENAGCYIFSANCDGIKQEEVVIVEDAIKFGGSRLKEAFVFDDNPWVFLTTMDRLYATNIDTEEEKVEHGITPDTIVSLGRYYSNSCEYFLLKTKSDYSIFNINTGKLVITFLNHIYSNNHLVIYKTEEAVTVFDYRLEKVIIEFDGQYSFGSKFYFVKDEKLYGFNLSSSYINTIDFVGSIQDNAILYDNYLVKLTTDYSFQKNYKLFFLGNGEKNMTETTFSFPYYIESWKGKLFDGYNSIKEQWSKFKEEYKQDNEFKDIKHIVFGIAISKVTYSWERNKHYVKLFGEVTSNPSIHVIVPFSLSTEEGSRANFDNCVVGECYSDNTPQSQNNNSNADSFALPKGEKLIGKSESGKFIISQSDEKIYFRNIETDVQKEILKTVFDGSYYMNAFFTSDGKNVIFEKKDKSLNIIGFENLSLDRFGIEGFTVPKTAGINGYKPEVEFSDCRRPVWRDPITLLKVHNSELSDHIFMSPDKRFTANNNYTVIVRNRLSNKDLTGEEYKTFCKEYDFQWNDSDEDKKAKISRRKKLLEKYGQNLLFKYIIERYTYLIDKKSVQEKEKIERITFAVNEETDEYINKKANFTPLFLERLGYVVYQDNVLKVEKRILIGRSVYFLNYVSFSYDSQYLAFGAKMRSDDFRLSEDGVFVLYDIKDEKEIIREDSNSNLCAVWMTMFSKMGNVAYYDSTANAYIATKESDFKHIDEIKGKSLLCFSPSGKYIAFSDQNYIDYAHHPYSNWGHQPSGNIFIHSIKDVQICLEHYNDFGKGIVGVASHAGNVASAAFSSDERRLLAVGNDGVVVVRNLHLKDNELEDIPLPFAGSEANHNYRKKERNGIVSLSFFGSDGITTDIFNYWCEPDETLDSEQGLIYSADGKRLIRSLNIFNDEYYVKEGVKRIEKGVFHGIYGPGEGACNSLSRLHLPDSIEYIDEDAFENHGDGVVLLVNPKRIEDFRNSIPLYKKLFAPDSMDSCTENSDKGLRNNDNYGRHYGEYAGTYAQDVAGYSDDVINDAFDGEPDAYWNID